MKLLVNELVTEIRQKISGDKISMVEGVRLHLYKHRSPNGFLVLEIKKGKQTVATSEVLHIADISEGEFYHGQTLFNIKAHLRANVEYELVLRHGGGYAFSEAAYIGWCLDFDFHTYPKVSNFAHDYEVWVRKKI